MGIVRTILLIAFALFLVTVMILTWGSLGSAVMALCLILMVSSLLFQRFLTNRDADDFQEE